MKIIIAWRRAGRNLSLAPRRPPRAV